MEENEIFVETEIIEQPEQEVEEVVYEESDSGLGILVPLVVGIGGMAVGAVATKVAKPIYNGTKKFCHCFAEAWRNFRKPEQVDGVEVEAEVIESEAKKSSYTYKK